MPARLAPLLFVALGCHGPDDADDTGDTGDSDSLGVPDMPGTLDIGATDLPLALPFDLDASGTGTDDVGAVALAGNVGTIELDGASLATFVYEEQPWPAFGYTLYQGFAVASDRWDVYWLYCAEDALTALYVEGIGAAPLHSVGASGTCAAAAAEVVSDVVLPAVTLELPTPPTGYTVEGSELVLQSDGYGALRIDDRVVPFAVFELVDCTAACGTPGWTELHLVAWDDPDAIFAILYLIEGDADHVQIGYARALPGLHDPLGGFLTLPGEWTTPGVTARAMRAEAYIRPP